MKINRAITQRGFTLIEILMVISIIGILAALTVQGVKHASITKKRKTVDAVRESITSGIEDYHAAYGAYPPDNPLIVTATDKDKAGTFALTNQLFYELLSAPYNETTKLYAVANPPNVPAVDGATLKSVFGLGGIRNSLSGEAKSFFKVAQTNIYKPYIGNVQGFSVPVDLVVGQNNFWHYDASSQYRHNKQSYDLWAVYDQGGVIETNGNWKN